MSAPTTPFGKSPTQIPNYRDEFYLPRRSRVPSTVGLGVSVTIALCCVLVILGRPTILVIVAALTGALLSTAAAIGTRRHWLRTSVRPAAMRQAIAAVLGQPLPERLPHQSRRTLTVSRYQYGILTTPGPARRIVLTARHLAMLDTVRLDTITAALSRLEGIQYTAGTKKNRPGRYLFTPKPVEKAVKLTPREQIEKRMSAAAKDVFGAGAHTSFTWDENTDSANNDVQAGTSQETGEDYLLAVNITGIKGIDYALSGKQNQAGARLLSQLKERDFTYAACPHEDRFSLFRSPPLPAITMPPARTAPMLVDHKAYHRFEVPLGIGPHGAQALWHPAGASGDPHLLIIGGTGGGKTICLHGVIQAATQAAWRVWLIDGKRIEFIGYKNWRNVEFLAQDVDAQIRLIHLAYETMNTRYDLIQERKTKYAMIERDALVRLGAPRGAPAIGGPSGKGHRRVPSGSSAATPAGQRSRTSTADAPVGSSERRDSTTTMPGDIPSSSSLAPMPSPALSSSASTSSSTLDLSMMGGRAGRRPSRSADPPEVVPER